MCLQFLCYVALLSLVDCYSHVLCVRSDNRVLNMRVVLLVASLYVSAVFVLCCTTISR